MLIKILVVDDSASERLAIKNILYEYCVLTACDGVEAMCVLEEHDGINLLILDLNMPDMNRFQVFESLKEDKRFSKLRTIILSNYDELENEINGLKLGAADYIRKPINIDSLKARIDVNVALLRAQEALERQQDEKALTFDIIFDQVPIGIAISHSCDPKHPEDAIVRINPMHEQITGRTKEELINSGWAKLTHPYDLEEDMNNFRKLQSGEIKIYSMDKRYIKPDGSIVIIEELKKAGIYISIDDFGTGYSSLAREKGLKVDCLKIDKYFIDKLLYTDMKKAITSDIISISHKQGHCTIAEGVEYDIQLQYLKEHGYDKVQGYLVSKPFHGNDAIEFLEKAKFIDIEGINLKLL